MDNHCSFASFFVPSRDKFDILCVGTIRVNIIGLPKEVMTLSKSAVSRTTLRKYDKTDKFSLTSDVPVTRRSGSKVLALTVYKSIKAYQD